MADYMSPGGAASDAFERQMQAQAAQKRQALLDSLAAQKLASDMDFRKQEMEARHEEIESLRESRKSAAEEKAKGSFEKRVGNMVEGDIADPELLAQDKKFGTGYFRTAPAPAPAAVPGAQPMNIPGAVDPETGAPANPAAAAPLTEPQAPGMLQAPQPSVFIGNRVDRQKSMLDAKVKDISDQMSTLEPTDPKFKVLATQYEMLTNKSLPAAFMGKAGTTDSTAVMRQNPRSGSVDRLIDGQWVEWKGDVPKGAHFMTEPAPKDTSTQDARKDAAVSRMYEHAITDFNNDAKPVEDQLRRIKKMATSLSQGNNIADSTLAEQLITITAGGVGSGVRITNPEIDQVLKKSRTGWDNLTMALNRWKTAKEDEKQNPLFFSDEQKQGMRELLKAFKTSASASLDTILKLRDELDEAQDEGSIKKLRTKLKRELLDVNTKDAGETSTGAPGPVTKTPEELYKLYANQGKK